MSAIPVRPDPAVGREVAPLPSGGYGMVKRAFDAVVAAALLAGFALPMVLIAIAIRLDSPGPALFRQRRSGRGSREFVIFKFRTMAAGTPDLASHLIAGNADAENAATQIKNFARKRLSNDATNAETRRELELVIEECDRIIKQCKAGWY